jgi:sigma-E factor negative regulatory protein RseB
MGGSVVILLAVVALCLLAGGSARAVGPAAHAEGGPDVSHLRDRGWTVPGVLPRRLKLFTAEEHRRDGTPLTGEDEEAAYVHLGYSDGTSVVSVFIQKGQLDAARLVNWHVRERFGHTIWVQGPEGKNAIWSSGDYVYTVFADAPEDVVDSAVAALPHESESGFWERLTRGVDRVIAWANPFG